MVSVLQITCQALGGSFLSQQLQWAETDTYILSFEPKTTEKVEIPETAQS